MTDGFAPIEDEDAIVLILGTGPSQESLRRGEYYAHPMNAFWPVMESLLAGRTAEYTYEEKKALLRSNHIALWDVLERFERKGSLDSGYTQKEPNELIPFIKAHTRLKAVLFTGKKAEEFYRKLVGFYPDGMVFEALPSPSSANTLPLAKKKQWYGEVLKKFISLYK